MSGHSAAMTRRALLTARPHPQFAPRPPGADSIGACTGCGACVEACPDGLLLLHDGRVRLDPQAGECTFCGNCAAVCEAPVFTGPRRMAHRVAIGEDCLARAGIACMTCRDACPEEEAVEFRPRLGGPFLPQIDAARCTGCGACVASCPGAAIRAVAAPPAEFRHAG